MLESGECILVNKLIEDGEWVHVKGEDGARTSAPSGKLINFIWEDTKTLIEVIQRGCKISGNGRCMGWKSSTKEYSWLTYQEFMTRAKHFGSGLMKMGADLGQSTRIGIYAKTSLEWDIAFYGCLYYSSPIVPLYDTLGPDASIYMINQGAIEIIICDDEKKVKNLLDRKNEIPALKHIICVNNIPDCVKEIGIQTGVTLYLFDDIEKEGQVYPVPTKVPKETDVVEICYTSGTTGTPKGAVLTHGGLVSSVQANILRMGSIATDKSDTMIAYLPSAHLMEQFLEFMVFYNGGSVGFFGGDVSKLADDMKILQPTYLPAVPRLLNKLFDKHMLQHQHLMVKTEMTSEKPKTCQNNGFQEEKSQNELAVENFDISLYESFKESLGGKVKLVVTGAAPILDSVLKFYKQALGCNIVELYGQTECSGPCTANILTDTSFGHVGTPLVCYMIKLVDVPELGYYASDNTGEVCVKGYPIFKEYYKDPERTKETIDEDGWLHSGDIGMWLPNGRLKIIDRKKHIFKLSQGEYVAPERLENVFMQSPYVSQILTYGDSLQSYVVAIVIPNEEIVMSWCKENLKCSTFLEACENEAVKQLILEDLKRLAKKAKILSFEEVKKIHLHPYLLTYEDGFLTPTSKTKRAICLKYFEKELKNLYIETEE